MSFFGKKIGSGEDPVKKRMTFLNFLISSFQNLIFCEILWLASRKKIHARNRLNFYLQEKLGLLGNYVALWKHLYYRKKCG